MQYLQRLLLSLIVLAVFGTTSTFAQIGPASETEKVFDVTMEPRNLIPESSASAGFLLGTADLGKAGFYPGENVRLDAEYIDDWEIDVNMTNWPNNSYQGEAGAFATTDLKHVAESLGLYVGSGIQSASNFVDGNLSMSYTMTAQDIENGFIIRVHAKPQGEQRWFPKNQLAKIKLTIKSN